MQLDPIKKFLLTSNFKKLANEHHYEDTKVIKMSRVMQLKLIFHIFMLCMRPYRLWKVTPL